MTAPAADKTSENQRRQNRQRKKDEPRVDCSLLQRVHTFRGLDGRNRFAHDPPLNDVSDHHQIEQNERRCPPAASLRFANAAFLSQRILASRELNQSLVFRSSIFTTAFHKFPNLPKSAAERIPILTY